MQPGHENVRDDERVTPIDDPRQGAGPIVRGFDAIARALEHVGHDAKTGRVVVDDENGFGRHAIHAPGGSKPGAAPPVRESPHAASERARYPGHSATALPPRAGPPATR